MDNTNVIVRNRLYQLSKDSPSNYSERGNFITQCTDSSNDPLTRHGINNFNRDSSSHISSQHIIAIGSNIPSITHFHSISQSDEMYNGRLSISGTLSRHDYNTDLHFPLSTSNSYNSPYNNSERGTFVTQNTMYSNDSLSSGSMNNFSRNSSFHIRSQHIIANSSNMPSITNFHSISQSDEMYNGHLSIRGTLSRHVYNSDLHFLMSTSNSYDSPNNYSERGYLVTQDTDSNNDPLRSGDMNNLDMDYFSECSPVLTLYDD